MSILIKGIDMPKSCNGCEFNYYLEGGSYEWWECVILHDDINQFDTRRTDCPLIDIVHCKECIHFHYDKPYIIQGIPVLGHEVCDFWGDGCKTNPNSFCSYGERK